MDDEDSLECDPKKPADDDDDATTSSALNSIEESDGSSVTTLSTIQSRHVTPLATPTIGLSKGTTPRSSFTAHDRTKPSSAHFDLAKLLDPFEQLEREFNWDDVTIRPPSAFSSMVEDANHETMEDGSKR